MKLAACHVTTAINSRNVVTAMAEAMRLFEPHRCRTLPNGDHGALACVETSEDSSAVKLTRRGHSGNILLIAGVPLDLHGRLNDRLDRVIEAEYGRAAEELSALDGAFVALFWDAAHQKLVVVTDPLGLQPLYMARPAGTLLLASELKAMPASGLVDVEMDLAGWGAFVGFGYAIGERTQLKDVCRVGPALRMIYDAATGSLESETYWHWPQLQHELTLEKVDTERMVDAMRHELAAYAQHKRDGTMLLSAGFDSRITLALLKQEGWNPDALVLAHQDELGGWEGKLGVRLARHLDTPVHLAKPPRSYYSSHAYLDYLIMNEVTTPSLYLFIAQVSAELRKNMGLIWDGTPPGYAFVPPFLSPGGFDVFRRESQAARDSYVWGTAFRTFGQERAEAMYQAVNELAQTEMAKYPDDEFGVLQFEVMNRMRNRTAPNCLRVYANYGTSCMLAVSRPFWDYAGGIPFAASKNYDLYRTVLRRHFPGLADLPILSGGQCWCDHPLFLQRHLAVARHAIARSRIIHLMRKAHRRWVWRSRRYWTPSRWLPAVRDRMELDHPDLNPDGVRELGVDVRLPFYWQTWRWIMSGTLSTWNRDAFFDPAPEVVRCP
ncbi:MAG: hypothetical protein ACYC0X_00345 [Pirellulaceae bacterium]